MFQSGRLKLSLSTLVACYPSCSYSSTGLPRSTKYKMGDVIITFCYNNQTGFISLQRSCNLIDFLLVVRCSRTVPYFLYIRVSPQSSPNRIRLIELSPSYSYPTFTFDILLTLVKHVKTCSYIQLHVIF